MSTNIASWLGNYLQSGIQALFAQVLSAKLSAVSQTASSNAGSRTSSSAGLAATGTSFDELIHSVADENGVDPRLVAAVAKVESGFRPDAVSSAGAMGLMQLMPATAQALGVTDPFDPQQNLEGGARYLKSLLQRFGDNPTLALAAYNAGPGAVAAYGGVPPYAETQKYVDAVLSAMNSFGGEWSV